MSLVFDPDSYPILRVQSRGEISQKLNYAFARKLLRRCCLRMTGGTGFMEDEHRKGLDIVRQALDGYDGVGLFGGTSIRSKAAPAVTIDTVTEVFPSLKSKMFKLGVIARHTPMRVTPYGLVINTTKESETFTVMQTGADSLLAIQNNVDDPIDYHAEADECMRLVQELSEVGWDTGLIVYNGGAVTERETRKWAAMGLHEPGRWNVLIIKGSGRVADKLASDEEFLAAHPHVRVVELNAERIREALTQFGAFDPSK